MTEKFKPKIKKLCEAVEAWMGKGVFAVFQSHSDSDIISELNADLIKLEEAESHIDYFGFGDKHLEKYKKGVVKIND